MFLRLCAIGHQLDLTGYGGGIYDTDAYKPMTNGDIKFELGGGSGVKALKADAVVMADGVTIPAGMRNGCSNNAIDDALLVDDGVSHHPPLILLMVLPCFLITDVVIYGTGFQKTYEFLSVEVRADLSIEEDGLYLYKNIFHTGVPGLSFVGSQVTTFNNILTHYLQAQLVAAVLSGRVMLPSKQDMDQDVARVKAWKRGFLPDSRHRASQVQLYMTSYHDELVSMMGFNKYRKGNFLSEWYGATAQHRPAALPAWR